MKNFFENFFAKEGMVAMNILNRGILLLFIFALAAFVPQGAEGAAYNVMDNDRILLMNNDSKLLSAVTCQSYYDTNTSAKTYWVHSTEAASILASWALKGNTHTMYRNDGTRLWHLVNCRAGSGTVLGANRNFIPWSSTAKSIDANNTSPIPATTAGVKLVGSVVFKNSEGACLYSPCYKDGIGTIYFDAVNAFVNDLSSEITLEIATNVTAEAKGAGITVDSVTDDYDNLDWKSCEFKVLTVKNAKTVETYQESVTNLLLASDAGYSNLFYRVVHKMNYRDSVRFRIRRLTFPGGNADTVGLVLLDNIIVSYPPMTAELHKYGDDFDSSLTGAQVMGCVGDFDKPFLNFKGTTGRPLAWCSFVTNSSADTSKTAGAVKVNNPKFHYQWRYLNQRKSGWREIPFDQTQMSTMTTTTSNLVGTTSLKLDDGVGDIEYYYTAELDAPYYLVKDYACSAGYGSGWTEKISAITNRANYTVDDSVPSCGTDYFVRLREGESDYEYIKMVTSVTTNNEAWGETTNLWQNLKEVRMELAEDHVWRYHYFVPTNMVGETLKFHFEGRRLATNDTAFTFSASTNHWYSTLESGLPYLPYTSLGVEAAGDEPGVYEAKVKLDDAATHLLIEFNDTLHSFSVSRATYQNFNMWTDAIDGFRGNANYNDENPTNGIEAVGVSDAKREFDADMGQWDVSQYYDDNYWEEPFDMLATESTDGYEYDVHRAVATTPKGWSVENGSYVSGNRGAVYNEYNERMRTLAWQMDGEGKGTMTLVKKAMSGVGSVSFSARVSQLPSFDRFSTYIDGTSCTNYALSAQLTMTRQAYSTSTGINPLDISPCNPSVSLVGYKRGTKGCYELRFVRVSDQNLACELYKWTQQNGQMVATLLTTNLLNRSGNSVPGLREDGTKQETIGTFKNVLVPEAVEGADAWTSSMFSLYTAKEGDADVVYLDGWLSNSRNINPIRSDTANVKHVIKYVDRNPGPLVKGSYGVGSCDCQAAFGDLRYHEFTDLYNPAATYNGVNMAGQTQTAYFEEDWELMYDEMAWMRYVPGTTRYESEHWTDNCLKAIIPSNQTIELLVAEATGSGDKMNWQSCGCVSNVTGFATNSITFLPHLTQDSYIQLRTGSASSAVAVDDVVATSWAAQDRGTKNYSFYDEWSYTAATVEPTIEVKGGNVDVQPAGTNGYVYIFTTPSKTIEFKPLYDMTVDRLLLVGGGGAGGWTIGGGGGGGGVVDYDWTQEPCIIPKDKVIQVVVGAGGDNYYKADNGNGNWKHGGSGGDSYVNNLPGKSTVHAKGGGGGAGWSGGNTGNAGGSGGGSAHGGDANNPGTIVNGGASNQPAPGYGNAGGRAVGGVPGGGGGAGAPGEDAHVTDAQRTQKIYVPDPANGGDGLPSDITGDIIYYGGGGGAGGGDGDTFPKCKAGGRGGRGGGGDGHDAGTTIKADDGVDGLGGGGAGGSHASANAGGHGGRGTVIMRVRSAAMTCTLQPARGMYDDDGYVHPISVRSPFLENGLSMLSFSYANADTNCVIWMQVCTNYNEYGFTGTATLQSPEDPQSDWVTVKTWDFSNTNDVKRGDLAAGTLTYYHSLRAPVSGLMRIVIAPQVIRKVLDVPGPQRNVDYGKITITKVYCYDEPKLDMRSWWGWNMHTEGWNTEGKDYAFLYDSPNGLSGMLNFSALEADNNARDANGIGLNPGDEVPEFAKNNPFVQSPPLTNGIGMVTFRARTFTNNQAQSSWVTLYGTTEPDAYQCGNDWEVWMQKVGDEFKPLAEFEITNSTFQTFSWKTTDDNHPVHSIRLEVNGARKGRYGQNAEPWERPQATPIQRVVLDEITASEMVVPRLVFRDVYPFRSKQLREDAMVAVSNTTTESEQPIVGESWGLQAVVEPQQLGDELDTDSVHVFAIFSKPGILPWGHDVWTNDADISWVELPRMGSNLVFRSHVSAPETIQGPLESYNTVQFLLRAEYKDKTGVNHTHYIDASEWKPPAWYYGLDDFNRVYGGNQPERFNPYTIIDTVSPRRAWINELNLQSSSSFTVSEDRKTQFVEFAVPRNADMKGWYLRVTGNNDSGAFSNRVLATFGYNKATTTLKVGSELGRDCTTNYTFLSLRSPAATDSTLASKVDGVWDVITTVNRLGITIEGDNNARIDAQGALKPDQVYGMALVRPTGVIEHEVVVAGRNVWEGTGYDDLEAAESPTNMLFKLKEQEPGSPWFYVGTRDEVEGTEGVMKSHGEEGTWTNRLVSTPGEINRMPDGTKQVIDDSWFLQPNGTNVWIYAYVDSPYIHQTLNGKTNNVVIAVIGKNDEAHVDYQIDKWYEIGDCTTNKVQVVGARGRGNGADTPANRYTLDLGRVQENLDIHVNHQGSQVVVDAGLSRTDPYYNAVMHWLRTKFSDATDSQIHLAEFLPVSGEDKNNPKKVYLDIRDMYWLDIDPTHEGWQFRAGMGGIGPGDPGSSSPACVPKPVTLSDGTPSTNIVVTVTMMITNKYYKTGTRGGVNFNQADFAPRAPQYLQGLEPGSSSLDYQAGGANYGQNWTSCTFKVTGALQKDGVRDRFYPLRWFIFGPESFDDNYQAQIEITDPFMSPIGQNYGWGPYRGVYQIFYRWNLDGNGAGKSDVELLKPNSTFHE